MTEIKKNVEVVALIYKSVPYLHFIVDQFKSAVCKADGWDVGVRIVANDATDEVIDELKKLDINYTIFKNPDPDEFYLNKVYRAFNYAVVSSKYDNVCLLNSDNVISENWLSNLLKHHDGINIPCSRLIESGKMLSGMHCVNLGNTDFGRHPNVFNHKGWLEYAKKIEIDEIHHGGVFGSPVFEKQRFIEAGGYPEGNVFYDENVELIAGCPNDRRMYKTSDNFFFSDILEKRFNMKHVTVFDSVVYHIIEGEKDA